MRYSTLQYFLVLFAISFLAACAGDSDDVDIDGINADGAQASGDDMKIYTLPSPLQVASAAKIFNMEYSKDLLNPTISSTANYPTAFAKALNIGVYGIDMGYTTIYEQKQEAIHYLSVIEKLAQDLDLTNSFSGEMVQRFERNIDNQDSLYQIILTSFGAAHGYLQENKREDVGLLIITGSFIEGLYLIAHLEQQKPSAKITNMIGQQRVYLENLIELLGAYSEQENVAGLIADLEELLGVYKGVNVEMDQSGVVTRDIAITDEQLKNIREKITDIRTSVVK